MWSGLQIRSPKEDSLIRATGQTKASAACAAASPGETSCADDQDSARRDRSRHRRTTGQSESPRPAPADMTVVIDLQSISMGFPQSGQTGTSYALAPFGPTQQLVATSREEEARGFGQVLGRGQNSPDTLNSGQPTLGFPAPGRPSSPTPRRKDP